MTPFWWAAGAVICLTMIGVFLLLMERRFRQDLDRVRQHFSENLDRQNETIHRQLSSLDQHLGSALTDTRQTVSSDLKSSGRLMADIHEKLGELSEVSRRIFDVGEDIVGLQELLRAPKIRGGMGEFFLEDLLSQILPAKFYETQYTFKTGEIVDAVILLGPNKICIDSKFPLEVFAQVEQAKEEDDIRRLGKEFQRGVKKHIDDIANKYIRPMEGTYDFALMYIPAESVYYETIIRNRQDEDAARPLFEYAVKKKVIPVSPNSIYAYLQVILLGLKGFQVESKTKEILSRLSALRTDFMRVRSDFSVAAKHLGNTVKTFDKTQGRMDRLNTRLEMIDSDEETEKIEDSVETHSPGITSDD